MTSAARSAGKVAPTSRTPDVARAPSLPHGVHPGPTTQPMWMSITREFAENPGNSTEVRATASGACPARSSRPAAAEESATRRRHGSERPIWPLASIPPFPTARRSPSNHCAVGKRRTVGLLPHCNETATAAHPKTIARDLSRGKAVVRTIGPRPIAAASGQPRGTSHPVSTPGSSQDRECPRDGQAGTRGGSVHGPLARRRPTSAAAGRGTRWPPPPQCSKPDSLPTRRRGVGVPAVMRREHRTRYIRREPIPTRECRTDLGIHLIRPVVSITWSSAYLGLTVLLSDLGSG